MKIVLYSHTFLPKLGGREIVVYQLARALEQLGHDVRVVGPRFTFAGGGGDFGLRVVRYPRLVRGRLTGEGSKFPVLNELEMTLQLLLELLVRPADVVHAHSTYPAGFLASRLKRWRPRLPLVITPHGVDINTNPPDFGMRLDPVLNRKIDRALRAADAITAISDGIERSLLEAGAAPGKLRRIPNGTDLDRFRSPPPGAVRDRFAIAGDEKIILTVGNYHPRKGQEDLVRAMPEILKHQPRARLVVVGVRTEVLVPLIVQLGLGAHVVLTGTLPAPFTSTGSVAEDPLAMLYDESSVYVSAGNNSAAEGLSLSVLDAMSAARPVVATRISGNEDVVEHGHNGFLVETNSPPELASRIVEILSDPAGAERLGRNGRARAEALSWRSVADQYLGVYREAIERARR